MDQVLREEFEACDPDGARYTISCYEEPYERPTTSGWERVSGTQRYRLAEGQQLRRIDENTFVTPEGIVLRRCRENCPPDAKGCVKI